MQFYVLSLHCICIGCNASEYKPFLHIIMNNTRSSQIAERNRDFLEKCLHIKKNNPHFSFSSMVLAAMEQAPKRYYIEYPKALTIIRKMLNNSDKNPYTVSGRREMIQELFETTLKLMRSRNWTLPRALAWALTYRSPSRFYISYISAYRIARNSFVNVCAERIG